jgi:Breast carcinoma amplified sequence 2 (BCAS2)
MVEEENAPEIYDSLPYYDNELEKHPELKEIVEKEFAKAPKLPTTLHPKVPPEPNLFAVKSFSSKIHQHTILTREIEQSFTRC